MPKAEEAVEFYYGDEDSNNGTLIEVGDTCYLAERGDAICDDEGPQVGDKGKVEEIDPGDDADCGPIYVQFEKYGAWWTTPAKLSFDPIESDDDEDDDEEEEDDEAEETEDADGDSESVTYEVGDEVRLLVRGDMRGDNDYGPMAGETGVVQEIRHAKIGPSTYSDGRYAGEQCLRVQWEKYGSWYVNSGRIEPVAETATEGEPMAASASKLVDAGTAPTVTRSGRQIILPEGMSNLQAIDWLKKQEVADKTPVAVRHEFGGVYPLDALVAVQRAMSDIYNWVANVPTPGFFGPEPPTMFTVRIGPRPDEFLTVPYGSFAIPGVRGRLEVKLGGPKGAQPNLFLMGEVAQGDMDHVKAIIARAEERLRASSIYRGKAVKVSWKWQREGEGYNLEQDAPQFLDLTQVSESDLVFSDDVQTAINDGLWTLLEQTDACRTNGVPLKRGILFEGPPGTGKTLTALVAAQKAVANGWTFVYLDDVRDLPAGLKLATQYAKAVVFAEDLDRVISGERDADMDTILNCLDGVDSKGQEIITIVTTNAVDAIIKPALRPGRIDMILSTRHPDAKAASTLVRNYGRGLLSSTANLDEVGRMLDGKIPAVIREVVERSKMAAIRRLRSGDIRGKVLGSDLVAAAKAMETHAALLERKEDLPVETTLRIPLTLISKQAGLEA